MELHTTELVSNCMKAVQLRHEGKLIGEMPTALFRGNLGHEALRIWHETGEVNIPAALKLTMAKMEDEGRNATRAVARDMDELCGEIGVIVSEYAARFGPMFNGPGCKLLGCELPIRWDFLVDGEPVNFASHLDMLYRSADGNLCLWDWKFKDEAPTWDYLIRNMQLGAYHLAVTYGAVKIGDDWVEFGEAPMMAIIHANNLRPYGRSTKATDDDGIEKMFSKGEGRPFRSIVRNVEINDESVILDELYTRVRMMRAGFYPTNPDAIGCHLCESKRFCKNFQGSIEDENQ